MEMIIHFILTEWQLILWKNKTAKESQDKTWFFFNENNFQSKKSDQTEKWNKISAFWKNKKKNIFPDQLWSVEAHRY